MALLDQVQQRRNAGEPIISLVAGEPHFDTPEHVQQAACDAVRGGATRYTPVHGTDELRASVRAKFSRDQQISYGNDEICVGAGAKQLIFNALSVTLQPDDEVIIPTPAWGSYAAVTKINDATPVFVATHAKDGFILSPEVLERAITPRTRWLILNTPSNPTGAVYTRSQLNALGAVVKQHPDMMVLSDEIYEKIVFDDTPFTSFAEAAPDLRTQTLLVNGVSKAYAMTGWRLGYGAGPAPLVASMAALQSQSTTNPCSITQAAAVVALDGPQDFLQHRSREYEAGRDLAVKWADVTSSVSCTTPAGAFYLWVSIADLLGSRAAERRIDSDLALVEYLIDAADVAVVPGSAFGASDHIRMSLAVSADQLHEALDQMTDALSRLEA